MNANLESLMKVHGNEEKARAAYQEIAELGRYGAVPIHYSGGLDVFSTLDPSNTEIDEATKDKIAKLSGVTRKDADKLFKSGTIITSEQVQDNKV
jgi:hypothetical protein